MNKVIISLIISLFAGLSTALGGLIVYFNFKNRNKFLSFSLSFASSIMLSLSILELFPESCMNIVKVYNYIGIFISLILFGFGVLLVNFISKKTPLLNNNLYRVGVMSMIALIMHNIPEGIATFMASYNDLNSGLMLAIAIMMHNIPEGIAISVPIALASKSKMRGVVYSLVAGLSEPLGGLIAYILFNKFITSITVSEILIIVSAIMISISINELLPESFNYNEKRETILGLILGFIIVFMTIFIL